MAGVFLYRYTALSIVQIKRRHMRHMLYLIILIFPSYSIAQNSSIIKTLPVTVRSGLLIEDIHGQIQFSHDTKKLFPPASTTKLLTALAAKLELGDDFYFQTDIKTNNDDIIVSFSGDPLLTYHNLFDLFKTLKQKNGSFIVGNIWLDNSAFTGYQKGIGWPWDILGVCYSAPSSAITLDRNCVQGSIYTLQNGKTRVHTPEQFPIEVSSTARAITPEEQKQTHCELELLSNPKNHYKLKGCLTKRTSPLPLKFAIQNPDLYTTRIVYKILNNLDMHFSGQVLVGLPEKVMHQDVIATHASPRLPALLDIMLKKSDNLIANNLTKSLGQHFYLQAGSFTNGTNAIKQILHTKANIDLSSAQLFDGSGLSRNNRLTANQISHVLQYILRHDSQLHLIKLLPVAGESGTLKYRRSMRSKDIRGKIQAKSGSLYGSYNMAGYGLDRVGKPKNIFVQLITDYFPNEKEQQLKITPLTRFENAFYKEVINSQ